jgi:acetate kinase
MDAILTLNAGSSSIKFGLFAVTAPDGLQATARGQIERIDSAPRFVARDTEGTVLAERDWPDERPDFAALVAHVIAWAETDLADARLVAVGHRIVHGGPDHDRPEKVSSALLAALDRLSALTPLHEPHNVAPIRAVAAARPALPQVACFDTGFHRTMPAVAARYALPRDYETAGVRRYGFHGLSYEYIALQLHALAPDLARGRVVVAHLGNGASLCALAAGRSIDTTMGFTALDGLVMGTRCGSIDPGVILYLLQQHGLDAVALEDLLYRRSGLLGVSGGIASDMRTLLASADPRARDAVELFAYRIARETGALANSLGGLDGFVFTAGIGEHAPPVRAMVCDRLAWLGVRLDPAANECGAEVISAADSRVAVRVIATDEEAMIARHTLAAIRPPPD